MKYLQRLIAYVQRIGDEHGRTAAAGLVGLLVFGLVAALSGILVLVSPYLGALFALLLMIFLSALSV